MLHSKAGLAVKMQPMLALSPHSQSPCPGFSFFDLSSTCCVDVLVGQSWSDPSWVSHMERLHEKPWNDILHEHALSHASPGRPDLLQTLAKGILLAGDARVRRLLWVEGADEWSVVL